ncbi:glycogen debranching protein GlgX [candidate division KSB1 bacterium]
MRTGKQYKISPGVPYPVPLFGANIEKDGVVFRVFSRNASRMWLLFFDNPEDTESSYELELEPEHHRFGDIWHVFIEGIEPGQLYLYRADGAYEPENGHLFDNEQWLLDPFAKAVTGINNWGDLAAKKRLYREIPKHKDFYKKLHFAGLPKCVVIDDRFDWEGDRHLHYPPNETVIYEAHVRGLTAHPAASFSHPGTFKGITEIIPHFKELGVTTLELLPVQEFNELESDRTNPVTGEPLLNYWGYNTVAFFSPNGQYSSAGVTGSQTAEFKTMVKALHKEGIEVILDVVFNHTAEGNAQGYVYSFKGFDNSIYYLLDENDKTVYKNYSGCGNSVNCNHPHVRRFIINCLRYWVLNMHVDGFRFDLASILGRDQQGELMENPPLIEAIAEDPVLRNTKLIAEAWDAGGAYQVGSFPGERWAEWNGKFRDDIRAFLKGDKNTRSAFAYRLTGSSDLYMKNGQTPVRSINYVTSHDGFTLYDLVSYKEKHNEANGEENRDGENNNMSENYGVEGETDDVQVNMVRSRQIKNFFTVLLLSQGVPMMTAGDEFRRSQQGNNNAYCHDNEISWIDWRLKEKNRDLFRFCSSLIAFRKRHPVFRRKSFFTGKVLDLNNIADITWYDFNGTAPDWSANGHTLACLIHGKSSIKDLHRIDNDFFLMINASAEAVKFAVPKPPTRKQWYVAINTARSAPNDIYDEGSEASLRGDTTFWAVSRSITVLIAK